MAAASYLTLVAFLFNMTLGLSAPPRFATPMAGAYIYLADNECYSICNATQQPPDYWYDQIPATWSNISFNKVDVLYVGPGGVQYANGSFGLYNSYQNDSLATLPFGSLANRFNWVVATARKQNPNIKILISQWPNVDLEHDGCKDWGFDWPSLVHNTTNATNSAINTYANSVAAFVQKSGIDGFDIDYEGTNIISQTPQTLSSIRTSFDALSKDSNARPLYVTTCALSTSFLADAVPSLSIVNMMSYGYVTKDMLTQIGLNASQLTYGFFGETTSAGCEATDTNAAIRSFTGDKLAGIFQWRLNSPQFAADGYAEQREYQAQIYNAVHNITNTTSGGVFSVRETTFETVNAHAGF